MTQKAVETIYNMETKLLKEVVDLLNKNTNLATAEWKLKKYRELTGLKKESIKIIKKDMKYSIKLSNEAIKNEGVKAVEIIDNTLSGNLPVKSDPRLKAIWSNYEKKTQDDLFRLGAKLLQGVESMYVDIIEQATYEVLAGQITLRDAIKQTSAKWTKDGFKPIKDAANRQWTSEGYSQMVIRSGIRNSVTDLQIERCNEYDHDLVEIDSHIGARPLCALYQGKVYSLSGKDKNYTALNQTSYGEAAGLFGINCGHRMYPYIQGSKKTYNPYPSTENKEVYKQSQLQRRYERQIRYYKRDTAIYGTDNKEKIAAYQSKLRSMPRTRRNDREQIY